MNVIGIDPGLGGAIVLIDGENPFFWDMPTLEVPKGKSKQTEKMFDIAATWNLFQKLYHDIAGVGQSIEAFLEWNSAMAGEGVVSAVRIGEGRMLMASCLQGTGIRWNKISSQSWTKPLKVVGKKESAAIAQRYELACRLYPSISSELTTPRGRKLDGRIDALLIAHYYKNKGGDATPLH